MTIDANPTPQPPSFVDRWAELLTTRQSLRRWSLIADAIDVADATLVNGFGDLIVRGGEDWCRLALTALDSPRTVAWAATLPDALTDRCVVEFDLIRAWLTAPTVYPDDDVATVADTLNLLDFAQDSDDTTHQGLNNLIRAAGDAGLFGVRGFDLELHRIIDADSWFSGYLLIARPEFGPGLATPPLVDGFLPDTTTSPIEAALAALTNIATAINSTLDSRDAAAETPSPATALTERGHTFPALQVQPAAAAPAPGRPDAPGPGQALQPGRPR